MAEVHATLSPSSADRWMTCPGSVALSEGYADSSSAAADEGTAAHELAERILRGAQGDALVGLCAQNFVEWTSEMLQDVLRYTSSVQALVGAVGGALMVEQRLPISEWTGEADAHGTADAVILAGTELIVADLKFGRGVVVDAGATCVAQPGGSMRDQEVIDAANERGVAMVFTGVRHFRH